MKTKPRINIQRMNNALLEIKSLCKKKQFIPHYYSKKEPSIWHFVRVLISNKIMIKKFGLYEWIGNEPNAEMSKIILDGVQKYSRTKKQEFRLKKLQKLEAETKGFQNVEKLQFEEEPKDLEKFAKDLQTNHELKDIEILMLKGEIDNLKKEKGYLVGKNQKFQSYSLENLQLKIVIAKNNDELLKKDGLLNQFRKDLSQYENDFSDLLKENENLKHQIHEIFGKKSKAFNENFEQIKQLIVEKPISRKVKLFGLTILKIE